MIGQLPDLVNLKAEEIETTIPTLQDRSLKSEVTTLFPLGHVAYWSIFWETWNHIALWKYNVDIQVISINQSQTPNVMSFNYLIEELKNEFKLNFTGIVSGFYVVQLVVSKELYKSQTLNIEIEIFEPFKEATSESTISEKTTYTTLQLNNEGFYLSILILMGFISKSYFRRNFINY